MPDDRPTLIPPLPVIYDRLSEVERERAELRRLLRLALDREDLKASDKRAATSAPRKGGAS